MQINLITRAIRFLALLCALALVLAGCSSFPATVAAPQVSTPTAQGTSSPVASQSSTPTTAPRAAWPTAEWQTSSPEAQGMDSHKLAEMLKAIEERGLDLHSLLIIRNGYLVSENYFGAYEANIHHQQYSVTKSFIATLIGIALDKGYIKDTDQRIVDFFPERTFDNLTDQKIAMTLDDTLTMRTGLDWEEGDPAYRALYTSPDWVKYMLDKPMAATPGTQFNYCSGCSHLLSAIVQQSTGMNPRDFAEQYLFKPLGITDYRWDVDAEGTPIGGWGLQLTPRDMAKLGYLFLHGGNWDGRRIVSAEWVTEATRTQAEAGAMLDYGYQWWVYSAHHAYLALGRYGQTIYVLPDLDMIIVTTAAEEGHDHVFELADLYLIPAAENG
jgi:CubicO group peptidase (beta-lactamase class C family)